MKNEWKAKPCHFVMHEGVRVLISGCWGTVHSDNIADCYCYRPTKPTPLEEVAHLSQQVREMTETIRRLRESNDRMYNELQAPTTPPAPENSK